MPKVSPQAFAFFAAVFIAIGLFFRLWKLNMVPAALYHDEMDYAITGESVARYGTDLSGTWKPTELKPLHTLNYTAELPAIFHALVQSIFGFGPDSMHVTGTIFGLLTIALASLVSYRLWFNRWASVGTVLLLLITPWHVHISRMGYEISISVFFQLLFVLGGLLILQLKKPMAKQMVGLLALLSACFFLGFFTYHAAKFTMPALAIVLAGLVWWKQKTMAWKLVVSGLMLLLITTHVGYSWKQQQQGLYGNRSSELIFSSAHLAKMVNQERGASVEIPGSRVVISKPVVLFREVVKRYAFVFDVYRLFITGYEGGFQFSLIVYGFFHLSTLLFVIAGFARLAKKATTERDAFLAFLVVSPVATTITILYQIIFRSALTYMLLLMVAGLGLYVVFEWARVKYQWLGVVVLSSVLLAECLWFGYNYFARYGVVSANNHYFAEKLLAGYAQFANQPIIVVTDTDPYSKARSLVYYNQRLDRMTTEERLQFAHHLPTYNFENVKVTTACPNLDTTTDAIHLADPSKYDTCGYKDFIATTAGQPDSTLLASIPPRELNSPIDSGTYYFILNDGVCAGSELNRFVHVTDIDLFDLTNLDQTTFCHNWVTTQ